MNNFLCCYNACSCNAFCCVKRQVLLPPHGLTARKATIERRVRFFREAIRRQFLLSLNTAVLPSRAQHSSVVSIRVPQGLLDRRKIGASGHMVGGHPPFLRPICTQQKNALGFAEPRR